MKIKQTLLIFALIVGFGSFLTSSLVSAATCGGVNTSVIGCDQTGGTCSDNTAPVNGKCISPTATYTPPEASNTGIWGLLLLVINILSAGIGIVAVGGVIYGSILYTSAGGSPEQTKQAKVVIANIVVGLFAYAFMYAFLNFIIPGGLFKP